MAFQYGAPPGAYGQPPYGFPPGGPPPSTTPGAGVPGMGAPPGMDIPPGFPAQTPAGMPAHFQPPPNMGNFDFNAPIIRLGGDQKPTGPSDRIGGRDGGRGGDPERTGHRGRAGLGGEGGGRNLDRDRQQIRESMLALQPPTREEVARTIFVGGLGQGAPGDDAIEAALHCAGKLRRWTRARDADDRKCTFGFAEYEDVNSLEAANEIFKDGLDVPMFKNGQVVREDDGGEVKTMKMSVVVDEQSQKYIEEWTSKRKEGENERAFRLENARDDLRQCIAGMANANAFAANAAIEGQGFDGDTLMGGVNGDATGDGADVLTIPLSLEDELSDIPADMRTTVAAEIKSFRDRSNRRDLERMRREEDQEPRGYARPSRLASPPASSSAANNIPVGPRSSIAGAPSGPRGFRGAQLPSDYANGVSFIGTNGTTNGNAANRVDEDAEESDEELERCRRQKREDDLERQYLDQERKWLRREAQRSLAQDRERAREEAEQRQKEREFRAVMARQSAWNDEEEARLNREEYYADHSAWLRRRTLFREREDRDDAHDRQMEEKDKAAERARHNEARGMADEFLAQTGAELAAAAEAQPLKFSLGSAAAKNRTTGAPQGPRRAVADIAGLLEDEEDAAAAGQRKPELKPLTDLSTVPISGADLSETERADAKTTLAHEIPTDTASLFAQEIRWSFLTNSLLERDIRPFVEKKVVEYLGVQEDLLVEAIMNGLRERKKPQEMVGELEGALEEDAEGLVRKVWRMIIFWGESESRGLNA